jgi:hypothetical protein
MKTTRPILWLSILALLLGGCDGVVVRKYSTHGPGSEIPRTGNTSGNTAGGNVTQGNAVDRSDAIVPEENLAQCGGGGGIIDVVEDTSQNWYQLLTTQYQLPATTPLLQMLSQLSGCFKLPDPERSYKLSVYGAMQSESDRALYGDLGSDWDIAYILTPSINFAPDAGTGMRKLESVVLTLTDARSGAKVNVSIGSPGKNVSLSALIRRSYGAPAADMQELDYLDRWHSTPEGTAISGAFIDAFNQMILAAGKHDLERAAEMGRSTGYVRDQPTAVLMPVRQAQMRLAELKFYAGAIDGVAGLGMAKALSAFQRAKGLRVTGQLDLASSAALAKGN